MTSIRIRDIPDDVHEELARRAHNAHQPLEQYTRALVMSEARRSSMPDLLSRARENARRWGGSYGSGKVIEDLRVSREARELP